MRSESGEITVAVPRDRQGEHTPTIIPKYQKTLPSIEGQIVALYAKGMSTRDIQDHLQRIYGLEVSPIRPIYTAPNQAWVSDITYVPTGGCIWPR